jgi:hypothetical protein
VLITFSALLLLFFFVGHLILNDLRVAAKQTQQNKIAAIGILKAQQVNEWLNDRHADINTLAVDSYFAAEVARWMSDGSVNTMQRTRIENRLHAFIEAHHYHSITLFNARGSRILNVGKRIEHEENLEQDALLAMQSANIRFIDLHRHTDSTLPVGVGFISPLIVADKPAGALYFTEDPSHYLFPLIETWPVDSSSAETQLVRIEGDNVLFLNRLRRSNTPPMSLRLPLKSTGLAAAIALRGKIGILENAHDYQNTAVLSFATPIHGTSWILIAEMAEDEAYAFVDRLETIGSVLALLVFIFAGIAFRLWQWREQAHQRTFFLEQQARTDASLFKIEQQYHDLFDNAAVPILEEDFSLVKAHLKNLESRGVTDFREHFQAFPEELRLCAAKVRILALNHEAMTFFGVSDIEELKQYSTPSI